VFRRALVLLPVLIAGLALPVAPALAGEDEDSSPTLHNVRDCVSDSRLKVTVSGDEIDSVAFSISGKLRKTATQPASNGTFVLSMRCSRLTVGIHKGRAVVTDTSGDTTTRRFTITRAAQFSSPRFTG
jgi:hypothetical protein